MKKLVIILFLLSVVVCAFGFPKEGEIRTPNGANYVWDDTNKVWRPISSSASGVVDVALSGGVSITIGSSTFTSTPVYADGSGSGTLGLVDSSRRVIINLGSETIGLLNAISTISALLGTASETDITLTPNTPYIITPISGVRFVSISNASTSGEFWHSLKTTTIAVSTGQKVYSNIEIEGISFTDSSIISSEALPIHILQAGY